MTQDVLAEAREVIAFLRSVNVSAETLSQASHDRIDAILAALVRTPETLHWFECDVSKPHQHTSPWSSHDGPHPMEHAVRTPETLDVAKVREAMSRAGCFFDGQANQTLFAGDPDTVAGKLYRSLRRAAIPSPTPPEGLREALLYITEERYKTYLDERAWRVIGRALGLPRSASSGRIREALASPAPDPGAGLRYFLRGAAAQLHDVNGHIRWEGNRPTSEPFDWTTNCQHVDCVMVRQFLAASPAPDPGAGPAVPAPLAVDAINHAAFQEALRVTPGHWLDQGFPERFEREYRAALAPSAEPPETS